MRGKKGGSAMNKKMLLTTALSLLFCIAANAQAPELVPAGNINTSNSPTIQSDATSNPIYTVNGQGNDSGTLFRPPPNSPYSVQRAFDAPLIYVEAGGLEPDSNTYSFPFASILNTQYTPMSFSFSGTAASLVFYTGTGWGTVNTNGGFMPYLLRNDYRDERKPYYEFFWSPQEKFSTKDGITTQTNPNITLNYVFKVPAQTEVRWGTENSFTRFTFAGGPQITESMQSDKVFKWAQGSIGSVDSISNISTPSSWEIPQGLDRVAGFALSSDESMAFAAGPPSMITAFKKDGSVTWQTSGAAPLITYGTSGLFTMSSDYRLIQYIDTNSGKVLARYQAPQYLPRDNNTFAVAAFSSGNFLFLQVPQQTGIYIFKIK